MFNVPLGIVHNLYFTTHIISSKAQIKVSPENQHKITQKQNTHVPRKSLQNNENHQ